MGLRPQFELLRHSTPSSYFSSDWRARSIWTQQPRTNSLSWMAICFIYGKPSVITLSYGSETCHPSNLFVNFYFSFLFALTRYFYFLSPLLNDPLIFKMEQFHWMATVVCLYWILTSKTVKPTIYDGVYNLLNLCFKDTKFKIKTI